MPELLANATVAYLLLLLGVVGLMLEMSHPGAWLPGLFGLLCLVLAFLAFQNLPVNYAALVLLLLGLLLLLLEIKLHTFGLLTAGLVCALLGSAALVEPTPEEPGVSWLVFTPSALAVTLIALFLASAVFRAYQAPVRTGMEALVGAVGVARTDIAGQGFVFVSGELWRAHCDQPLGAGQAVRVRGYDGLTLHVAAEDVPGTAEARPADRPPA